LSIRPNWRMSVARDGVTGLEMIRSELPDLVLLDLHLPLMDGSELLHRLRTDPRTNQLYIVVLSADANPHQKKQLLAAGANDYCTKPLDMDKILDLLDVRQLVVSEHSPPGA
jgi:CheY-like chemotaxis protein